MKPIPEEFREAAKLMKQDGNAAELRRLAGLIELVWKQALTEDLLREINGYVARGRRLMVTPETNPEPDKKSA